jgi:hypothetical protein
MLTPFSLRRVCQPGDCDWAGTGRNQWFSTSFQFGCKQSGFCKLGTAVASSFLSAECPRPSVIPGKLLRPFCFCRMTATIAHHTECHPDFHKPLNPPTSKLWQIFRREKLSEVCFSPTNYYLCDLLD